MEDLFKIFDQLLVLKYRQFARKCYIFDTFAGTVYEKDKMITDTTNGDVELYGIREKDTQYPAYSEYSACDDQESENSFNLSIELELSSGYFDLYSDRFDVALYLLDKFVFAIESQIKAATKYYGLDEKKTTILFLSPNHHPPYGPKIFATSDFKNECNSFIENFNIKIGMMLITSIDSNCKIKISAAYYIKELQKPQPEVFFKLFENSVTMKKIKELKKSKTINSVLF